MSEVLSALRVMPETKTEIKSFGESLISSIQFGDVNPLEIDGRLKAMEELIKLVRSSEEMQEGLISEAAKYGAKSFEEGNFKYQQKEVGVKYDFSECNDSIIDVLIDDQNTLKKNIKERQDFLKALPIDSEIYGDDGVKLERPAKTSTTKVITLLK